MSSTRESGILLHVTSLPGPYGIGDLGHEAYRFADFLARSGQTLWQVLPVVPTGHGHSPYASPSTFAGNPMFISPDLLVADGLLTDGDLADLPGFSTEWVDFDAVIPFKTRLLDRAYERFASGASSIPEGDYRSFVEEHAWWVDDYALFEAIKGAHAGAEWTQWPKPLATREADAIAAARETHAVSIDRHAFRQFLFDRQWRRLKSYCNERGIRIFGDLPIYVAQDSADVWSEPELFQLDDDGRATVVAGVPPDYFSETGQRWGNPIYRWDVMQANGFDWWGRRMARILEIVDLVRLDHFRGFEAYWEVPSEEETAIRGRWVTAPGRALFTSLRERLGDLPVVAENLGVITDEVTGLMAEFGFPGMAILQFAFDSGPENDFLPHNYVPDLVAYTGTHDNDTFMGWWTETRSTQEADVIERAKAYCREYLELRDPSHVHLRAIRALAASVARTVVYPLQDVLGYGSEARMNTPGLAEGNWGWRFRAGTLTDDHARMLRHVTAFYGRLQPHTSTAR